MKNPPAAAEQASLPQKSHDLRAVMFLVKYYPVVFCIIFAAGSFSCLVGWVNFTRYIYTITGAGLLFTVPVCLILSRIFKLCKWHRILVWTMESLLFMETLCSWGILHVLSVGNSQINVYIWSTLTCSVLGLLLSAYNYARGRKDRERSAKKIPPVLDENGLRSV